ncbi:MAG TPA: hypothetical protein VF178_05935 [Gemmatimonadaceae bacterium]
MTEPIDPARRGTPDVGPSEADLARASREAANWLHARGIEVFPEDTPEDLAELLDEVEAFERAVLEKGGDLMVAEPAFGHTVEPAEGQAAAPGQSPFVIPGRREHEPVPEYVTRLRMATESVRRYHR